MIAGELLAHPPVRSLIEGALDVGHDGVGLVPGLDEQPRVDVRLGVVERVLDHPLHLLVGEPVGRLDLDRLPLLGAQLAWP